MTHKYINREDMRRTLQHTEMAQAIQNLSDPEEDTLEGQIVRFVATVNYLAGEEVIEVTCDTGELVYRCVKQLSPEIEAKFKAHRDDESNPEIEAAIKKITSKMKTVELAGLMFVCGTIDDMVSEGVLKGPTLLTQSGSSLRNAMRELCCVPSDGQIARAMAEVEADIGALPSEAKSYIYERLDALRTNVAGHSLAEQIDSQHETAPTGS